MLTSERKSFLDRVIAGHNPTRWDCALVLRKDRKRNHVKVRFYGIVMAKIPAPQGSLTESVQMYLDVQSYIGEKLRH